MDFWTHVEILAMVMCVYNPRTGEEEMGKSLGFNQGILGSVRDPASWTVL